MQTDRTLRGILLGEVLCLTGERSLIFSRCAGGQEAQERVDLYMDLLKMIAELQAERHRLDEAIDALERLSAGKLRRRGRPPSWLKDDMERHGPGSEIAEEPSPNKTKKA